MQPLLTIEDLNAGYGGKTVIRNIGLTLREGEILGVVGESGSGKSTLLKAVGDLKGFRTTVYKGNIRFAGKDLIHMEREEKKKLQGEQISYIFQNPGESLNPTRRVRIQFYEMLHAHKDMSKKEMDDLIASVFERIGFHEIDRILDAYPFELSGGMAQRVVIALAVILRPRMILADEPTSALDTTIQKQVIEELKMLRNTLGTAMIVVTHNMGAVGLLADRLAVMYKGEIVESGKTKDVLDNPQHPYTQALLAAVPKLAYQREDAEEEK